MAPTTTPLPPKPLKKNNKEPAKAPRKTDRRELNTFKRGLIVNLSRYGASQKELAQDFEVSQAAISQLVKRTTERQTETGLSWYDEKLYHTAKGRGRKFKVLAEEESTIALPEQQNTAVTEHETVEFLHQQSATMSEQQIPTIPPEEQMNSLPEPAKALSEQQTEALMTWVSQDQQYRNGIYQISGTMASF